MGWHESGGAVLSHSTLHIPGEVQRVRPFTTDNVNTSCCEQGNVKILILQGQGGHTNDQGQAWDQLWRALEAWLCMSHSEPVCWFVFQCRPDQIGHEQRLSAEVDVMPVSVRSEPGILWRGLNSCVESGMWFSCSPWVDPGHTSKQRYDYSTGRQIIKESLLMSRTGGTTRST